MILVLKLNSAHLFDKVSLVFIFVSRANYFQKTGGRPKSEAPKWGHKVFKITK